MSAKHERYAYSLVHTVYMSTIIINTIKKKNTSLLSLDNRGLFFMHQIEALTASVTTCMSESER